MPRRPPQIVAFGGGGFSMEPANPLLDDYVLSLTELVRGRLEPELLGGAATATTPDDIAEMRRVTRLRRGG